MGDSFTFTSILLKPAGGLLLLRFTFLKPDVGLLLLRFTLLKSNFDLLLLRGLHITYFLPCEQNSALGLDLVSKC